MSPQDLKTACNLLRWEFSLTLSALTFLACLLDVDFSQSTLGWVESLLNALTLSLTLLVLPLALSPLSRWLYRKLVTQKND